MEYVIVLKQVNIFYFFSPFQESLDIFDTDKDGKISVDEYLGM